MVRLAIMTALERGVSPNPLSSLLAREWARRARLARPLVARVPSLCVGGATLGGSGKTPLAIACARFLAARGARVALVGHAYCASPPRAPRRVRPDDDPRVVGDEAVECARGLGSSAVVMVARRKQDALDAAAKSADVVVLDGPLQLAPNRATLSLLAVDARAPWGSGACPPLGDLRAPKDALVAATDRVVPVAGSSRGVLLHGELVRWDALPPNVGLVTAVARPSRVVAFLAERGVRPRATVSFADHAAFELPHDAGVDLWLTTPKDFARAPKADALGVVDYYLDLPHGLGDLLQARFPFRF